MEVVWESNKCHMGFMPKSYIFDPYTDLLLLHTCRVGKGRGKWKVGRRGGDMMTGIGASREWGEGEAAAGK